MIVPMLKVSLIVLDAERRRSLEDLKNLGVVHIEQGEAAGGDIPHLEEKKVLYEKALQALPPPQKTEAASQVVAENTDKVAEEIVGLIDGKRKANEDLERLIREEERLRPWGDYDPSLLDELADKSVHVSLCEASPDFYAGLSEIFACVPLFSSKTLKRFALVSLDGPARLPEEYATVKVMPRPERGIAQVARTIEETRNELARIEDELSRSARFRTELEGALARIEDHITFERVHEGMGREGALAFLTGFVPKPEAPRLRETASEKGWGLLLDEPAESDAVPTKIKNPKWIRIIEPIFSLLGTVPGYREFDISFFFLVFFCVFVSIIIGDAGYGSVLFVGILFLMIKTVASKKPISPGLVLFLVLSLCTIGWGAITGTWFSNQSIAESPFLKRLIIPSLYAFNPESGELVKYICFIIGTIHLSIAHIWNFIDQLKKKPFIKSFAQLGWLSLVLGLFYLVLNMVLDATKFPLPRFALFMIIGGVAFIVFFSKQEGKFIKGLVQGIGGLLTTFLSSISCFSDIISYIRLFAVGLATVAIANSFNQMASGGSGVVGVIGSIFILIFGHSLNLAMGALSVIVHGVRLNMLEFSGHLGMEWTGIPYKPFSGAAVKE